MQRDEVIRMAREAELYEKYQVFYSTIPELERFAKLVAAAEREACANLVEGGVLGHGECAALIRARGKQ